MLSGPNLKTWDFQTRALPEGHYIHSESYESMIPSIDYDIVLCQNKLQNYTLLRNIADRLQLPLIILDHTEPPAGIPNKTLVETIKFRADAFVTITPHNRTSWGLDDRGIVIPHGIDLEVFTGYRGDTPEIVNISNHFVARNQWLGYYLFRDVVDQADIKANIIGENPAHSNEFADRNIKFLGSIQDPAKLAANLALHRLYLNTTELSPLPMSLLEAMATGLPVVTTAKQQIPAVVRNGIEGFVSNDPSDLISGCRKLIDNPELARELGANSRKRIAEQFGMEAFVNNWNTLFQKVYYG